MRIPKDFDLELKALADKAKQLKERRVRQLGELVMATGADALDAEMLAGALLAAKGSSDMIRQEEWRKAGEGFFRVARQSRRRPRAKPEGGAEREGGGASA